MAKTSQLIYRLAGFVCLLEHATIIADAYLTDFGSFGGGQPNQIVVDRIRAIVEKKYGHLLDINTNQHLVVEHAMASRAKDVALANFEQYKLLLSVEKEDGRNWNVMPGRQMKSASPSISTVSQALHAGQQVDQATLEKPARRVMNLLNKTKYLKMKILLHDSIIFVKSGLYVNWELKAASLILDSVLLPELVTEGLLVGIDEGIDGKWNKPTVYIKIVPGGEISRDDLRRILASYGDERLTIDTYLDKCKTIEIEAFGKVMNTVFEVFDRCEYRAMEFDLTVLRNLKCSEFYYLLFCC